MRLFLKLITFSTVFLFAGQQYADDAFPTLEGTVWRIVDSDGDNYLYEFKAAGALHYLSPRGYFENGTWMQDGATLFVETNKRFQERNGILKKEGLEGTGKNTKGENWKWKGFQLGTLATRRSDELAGTIWRVMDTDGDNYMFEFRPDGILHYISPRGYFENGTWKQDGTAIYIETNKKFQERFGKLGKEGMEGIGKNTKNQSWNWTAVMVGNSLKEAARAEKLASKELIAGAGLICLSRIRPPTPSLRC